MNLLYSWKEYPYIFTLLMSIYYNTCNVMKKMPNFQPMVNAFINDIEEYILYMKNQGYDLYFIHEQLKSLLYINVSYNKTVNIDFTNKDQIKVINGDRFIMLDIPLDDNTLLNNTNIRRKYLYIGLSRLLFNSQENEYEDKQVLHNKK